MELSTVACKNCGAPLSIADNVRLVSCEHCGSQLEVLRRGGAAWTEIVKRLERHQQKLEQRVQRLEGQQLRRRPFRRRRPEEKATGPQGVEAVLSIVWMGVFLSVAYSAKEGSWLIFLLALSAAVVVTVTFVVIDQERLAKHDAARAARKREHMQRRMRKRS